MAASWLKYCLLLEMNVTALHMAAVVNDMECVYLSVMQALEKCEDNSKCYTQPGEVYLIGMGHIVMVVSPTPAVSSPSITGPHMDK